MAYFPKYRTFFNLRKASKFLEILTKLQMSNERKLSVFRKFISILRFPGMFYIIDIKKNLELEKQGAIRIAFLQVGEPLLHK